MNNPIAMFQALFTGRTNFYGQHRLGPITESKKRMGISRTIKGTVTPQLYASHVAGEYGLGIIPLTKDNAVHFAAIDIDAYDINYRCYHELITRTRLPFHIFESKSGGAHLFIFFQKPEPARVVVPLLQSCLPIFGLPVQTEIFPKQVQLPPDAAGNWINLPYFKETRRFYDGKKFLSFARAMILLYKARTTAAILEQSIKELAFSDGPPCLQALYYSNSVTAENHNRNEFLFNAAVYFKKQDNANYPTALEQLNSTLPQPLSIRELHSTILRSTEKVEYKYTCTNEHIHKYCYNALCKQRKYGINESQSALGNIQFGQLTQVLTNPPYYKWKINNMYLIFDNERDLKTSTKFTEYCIRYFHYAPPPIKPADWLAILNKALIEIEIEEVKRAEQLDDDSMIKALFYEFIVERVPVSDVRQMKFGRTYYNKKEGYYLFKPEAFIRYLNDLRWNTKLSLTKIRSILKDCNAQATKRIIEGGAYRAWIISKGDLDALEQHSKQHVEKEDVDMPATAQAAIDDYAAWREEENF